MKKVFSFILVALISSAVSIGTFMWLNNNEPNHYSSAPEPTVKANAWPAAFAPASSQAIETDFTKAAEEVVHAVVHIKSTKMPDQQTRNFYGNPFFDQFFGGQGYSQQPRIGMGSGVIITKDGYIVTNNHVIKESDELEVTLNDNRTFNAKVIGTDEATDLALLKIEAEDLPIVKMGDSDKLKVGEWVLAVGNPFQLNSTVTAGIVSAKARNVGMSGNMGIESYIQTDAAVNPGNSGGALVNTKGELVGINTALISETGNYAGCSFAVPSSIVAKVVSDIKQYGNVQRAILGVRISDINEDLAKEKNLTTKEGVYIGVVEERGAAMDAGLEEGDVIVGINGVKIKNTGVLQEQISRYRPGDKITVEYIRDGKSNKKEITLRNYKGNTEIIKGTGIEILGAAFKELSDSERREYGLHSGVQVDGIKDGKFREAGIRNGFIILRINDNTVSSAKDVEKIYNNIMKRQSAEKVMFIAGIYPNGKTGYYAVNLTD
ncbi:MAG TPA: Do family serine endopeptidase [Candidatus Gallibacteroides avistercoris]|uniref:Do family serine endopeptidase n=1 Tax=Candidatus Gallibacteroides avistercoris TaxID=2840833 RepID=A0A9D1SBU7_9BACT|nr:Do family serine endopeptidase [Candidatus Gallibacteroides avistercoris]